ncbi:hypothetical protein [Campylobacter concisus]|uniref:hypothetical protein n=1 Tax=Campylobacter concisus TaxID=199 RepID=UPI0015E19EEA|nr:hypothetical protein [Campylobacter concisus]
MKRIKSFFLLFSMFFSFLSAYAECLPMSTFARVIPSLDDKGGYKVFSVYGRSYYVVDSEIVQSPIPTCYELSGGEHFIGNGKLYNVTGSTTYQGTEEYSFLASSVSFSNYYPYNCSADQFLDLKTKQCVSCPKDHIFNQETGKCEPDKRPDWCPEPMIYNEIKLDSLFGAKIVEECVPDPKIDQSNCEKMGLRYHDGCHDSYGLVETAFCMSFPVGCWSPKTVNKVLSDKSVDLGLFVFGSASLPIKSLKNGLGSLSKFFMDLFSSGSKPPKINLLEYKPEIVDIKATKSGPEPVFDFKPVTDEAVILNDTFKKTGKVDPALSTSPDVVRSPQKLADFSPNLKKFDFPKDASAPHVENNLIVTAKLKDTSKPIPTKDITVPNEVRNINLEYDLNTMFRSSDKPTSNLPMTIKQVGISGNKTTYKGSIVTPDSSVIDVEVIETTTQTGSKVQDVTYSYNYKTPRGNSRFSTGYVNTISSDNKVTNSIPKDSTSTSPSNGSSSSGSSDSSSSTALVPSQSIDLSSLERAISQSNSKLDSINENLTAIKNQQQEQWKYEPNVNTATSFASLQSELAKFDVSVNDAFNFLNNLKGDIDNLMNNFNDSLDIINKGIDAPDIPKGTCPFTISGPTPGSNTKNLFEIDPCRFVAPYKSILTLFFTIWFSFEIIMFSLKYLFKVGGES